MNHFLGNVLSIALLTAAAGVAHAGPVPYSAPGTENPAIYAFTATNTGTIGGYFFSGQGASYSNEVTVLINGSPIGAQGLNNHSSAYGDYFNFGNVVAGDTLIFKMVNLSPGGIGPWYSDKSLNADGSNHIYSTDWAGDAFVPAGTYVAFEDLDTRTGGSDFNYNDLAFVFTNVNVGQVPEPGTLALALAAGFAAVVVTRRRQKLQPALSGQAA